MTNDTIAAISTPAGSGGIGIVRLSGPEAEAIVRKIFVSSRSRAPLPHPRLESHRLHHGYIVDPETGRTVDEVLVGFMKAPRSYTREDVVEINAHSGSAVLGKVLQLCVANGSRLAEAGEFTKRAFLSGRIDLSQAEAVIDVIQARTERALRHASAQMTGGLRQRLESVRDALIDARAAMEAFIDFPEDVGSELDTAGWVDSVRRRILAPLQRTAGAYETGRLLRDGVRCIIAGRPNVGKSSLMNRLLDQERVIVTEVPGTTRDIVEDLFHVDGVPFVVMDSAGIQETCDPVERIGIEKTRRCLESCDMVLMVTDAAEGVTRADRELYQGLGRIDPVVVVNKIDLLDDSSGGGAGFPPWPVAQEVRVSAKTGEGIDDLRAVLLERIGGAHQDTEGDAILPNLRQKEGMERAAACVERAIACVDGAGESFELAAIELAEACSAVDEVLGSEAGDDVLDRVFSRFCIGK